MRGTGTKGAPQAPRSRLFRRRAAVFVGIGFLVIAALVGAVLIVAGPVTTRGTGHAAITQPISVPKPPAQAPAPTAPAANGLGPDGVESAAMIAENKRPGTSAWQITGAPKTGSIDGWGDLNYAAVGDAVKLYVSTTAPSFRVVAYRMGFYGGAGAREVWESSQLPGQTQPACALTAGVNTVSCADWTASVTMPVTAGFVQGDYLLKLVGSGNEQSYIPLTVWDPASTAAYLFMNRSLTEQGWNTYGGFSYYAGKGPCAKGEPTYPVCNRARIVSFDRPYDSGDGASDFLTNEYPLLRLMEQHGLDVAYVTDITVNDHPGIVSAHRALLSLDHDETWTYPERKGAQDAADKGVNIAFFGAAAIVRHARLQSSPIGPDREEVDYRNSTEDPLNGKGDPMNVTGNTWAVPPTSWPTTGFVGEEYSGYLLPSAKAVPFVVNDAAAWIFKGTGLHNGEAVPGVIASDIDHVAASNTTPAGLQVLGHSPVPLSQALTNQGRWGTNTYSDMTYYTNPATKAGFFDSGTVTFIYTLTECPNPATDCPAPITDVMVGNLLWLFGQGPAGRLSPSVSNWKALVPRDS